MWLKLLACILMLVDHIGYYFAPLMPIETYISLRVVGRLAFPIFAYLIIVGMRRSSNVLKYVMRLSIAAILTQLFLELGFYIFHAKPFINVLFTFTFGLISLLGLEILVRGWPDMSLLLRPVTHNGPQGKMPTEYAQRVNLYGLTLPRKYALLIGFSFLLLGIAATAIIVPDYDLYGIGAMGMFYCADHLRKSGDDPDYPLQSFWRKASPYIMMFVFFALLNVYQLDASVQSGHSYEWVSLQMYSLLAIPFFPLAHRGKKPSPGLKYAFYVFYGLHLFLLMAFSAQLRMR